MQQDRLQIALEHHRAGRLRQAESGYQAVLADHPDDPEALHWLGVLLTQAGRAADAIPLLTQAVAMTPEDAAFQHNLGQALLNAGRLADAIAALTESAALQPERPDTFLALARAYAIRRSPGDAEAAVAALRRALAQGIDTPELHHDLGVALLSAGAFDEALASLARAVEHRPDYAAAYFQQAMAFRAKGDAKGARNALNKALEIDAQYAQAWHALAAVDAAAGNFDLAIGHLRRAIRYRPGWLTPLRSIETLFRRIGRIEEADAAAQAAAVITATEAAARAIEADNSATSTSAEPTPAVAALEDRLSFNINQARLHDALSAMSGLMSPKRASPEAMTKLFDRHADNFDHHLRDTLGYGVPEPLVQAVSRLRPSGQLNDVLDLGCGTGLCGPLLRPLAKRLVGVDLSPRMLQKATERNVYDQLIEGDLLDLLQASPESFDLLIAADVLIYMGDLSPVFEAAVRALRPGGLFALSVEETTEAERYIRNARTRRFAHSRRYLQRMGSIFGFQERHMEPMMIRKELHVPVPGLLAVFAHPDK